MINRKSGSGLYWRSILTLRGKKIRYITYAILVCIFTYTIMAVFGFLWTSNQFRKSADKTMGTKIGLVRQGGTTGINQTPIPDSLIEEAARIPNIIGYNTESIVQATPISFHNAVRSFGDSRYSSINSSPQVELCINRNILMSDMFRSGDAYLIDGNMPEASHNGVLIEDYLAEKNQLHIGSKIQIDFDLDSGSSTVDLPIVGIYHMHTPIQMAISVDTGTAYVNSPYSRIVAPYSLFSDNTQGLPLVSGIVFYVNMPQNLSSCLTAMESLSYDHSAYSFYDDTDYNYLFLLETTNTVDLLIQATGLSLIGAEILVLIIISLRMLQNFYNEIFILKALGESKRRISQQFFLQMIISSIFGTIMAAIISIFTSSMITNFFLQNATKTVIKGGVAIFDYSSYRSTIASGIGSVPILINSIYAILCFVVILGGFFLVASIIIDRITMKHLRGKV